MRVDGVEHAVDVRPSADGDPDKGQATIAGVVYDVIVAGDGRVLVREAGASSHRTVTVEPGPVPQHAAEGGTTFALEVLTAQQAALADVRKAAKQGAGATIVRVLVAEGDVVEPDAATVIVEAMKMENEVRTTGGGRIARVAVSVGDTVDAGQVLCELAAHPAPP